MNHLWQNQVFPQGTSALPKGPSCGIEAICSLLYNFAGTNPQFPRKGLGRWDTTGVSPMIGKEYFVRQAAILFGLAKATKDPKISAALLEKAADLKLQEDGLAPPNPTPLALDSEPPAM